VFLKFRNSTIQIRSQSFQLLEKILFDLKPFHVEGKSIEGACHTIHLNIERPDVCIKPPFPSLSWKGKKIWGWGRKRFVLYPGYGHLKMEISNAGTKTLRFQFQDEEELRIQVLLCIQALWGEDVEAEGLVRIHSLSLEKDEGGIVMMADSGSGKSFFALKILRDEKGVKVLSDETAWLDEGKLLHFPTPMAVDHEGAVVPPGFQEGAPMKRGGLGQKRIFQVSTPIDPNQTALREIIYYSASPHWIERLFWRLFFLAKLTLGYQLPQMFEILVRRDSFIAILKTAGRRVLFGIRVLVRNKVRPVFDQNHLSELDF